jgi:hypothetical protein
MTTKISPADLTTKVCKRGHIGQYRRQGNSYVCRDCAKINLKRYRGAELDEVGLLAQSEARLAEVESSLKKIRTNLYLLETEQEYLVKKIEILKKGA